MSEENDRAPCGCPYEWYWGQAINRDKVNHQTFCKAVPRYYFLDRDDTVKFVEGEFARLRAEVSAEKALRLAAEAKLAGRSSLPKAEPPPEASPECPHCKAGIPLEDAYHHDTSPKGKGWEPSDDYKFCENEHPTPQPHGTALA